MKMNITTEESRTYKIARLIGCDAYTEYSNLSSSIYITISPDDDMEDRGGEVATVRISTHKQRPSYHRDHDIEVGDHPDADGKTIFNAKLIDRIITKTAADANVAELWPKIKRELNISRRAAKHSAATRAANRQAQEQAITDAVMQTIRTTPARYTPNTVRALVHREIAKTLPSQRHVRYGVRRGQPRTRLNRDCYAAVEHQIAVEYAELIAAGSTFSPSLG